ncbi:MAG: nuclear transport factor 2 family protein [Chloroflexota bacterium]
MDNTAKQQIIEDYIAAYNAFDVDGMLGMLHTNIRFENYSEHEMTLSINGIDAFREVAQQASRMFLSRNQTIENIAFEDDQTVVFITYTAICAVDLSEDVKKGDRLNLKGQSVFKFKDNMISFLADYSRAIASRY